MSKVDKIELGLIVFATAVAVAVAEMLPRELAVGEVALIASALLLAQGLARDLWLKYGHKRSCPVPADQVEPSGRAPAATCMCVESSIGIFGVVAGVLALFSGAGSTINLSKFFWPATVLLVGLAGFSMKSLVIDWKSRRIRRESDHRAVRFGK